MVTFTTFNDRLPDPTFTVNDAGDTTVSGTMTAGPGFASATVRSIRKVDVSRTRSGRGIHRDDGSHVWEFDIKYHPMRKDQFDVVSAFLESRGGRMYPFYVVLPQHNKPKSTAFATFATSNTISLAGAHGAGDSTLLIDAPVNFSGYPRYGDYFTISDPLNVNHTKAYKVVRTEHVNLYQVGQTQPTSRQARIHISPPLTRFTSDNSVINWIDPAFRVIQKGDIIEHDLNTDNLYQFQLQLEEIQP